MRLQGWVISWMLLVVGVGGVVTAWQSHLVPVGFRIISGGFAIGCLGMAVVIVVELWRTRTRPSTLMVAWWFLVAFVRGDRRP